MFPLIQAQKEVFSLIFPLLCFQHILKWSGDVIFGIYFRPSDKNDGVNVELP